MTTVQEFGKPVFVELTPGEVKAIRATSRELQGKLGLRGEPFLVETSRAGVRLRAGYVAGFMQVGGQTIEVAPKFLAQGDESPWRDAFLAILARLGKLASMPRAAGVRSDAGLPDLMGIILNEALTRAWSEGLPRRYDERRADLASLRGQLDVERLWRRFQEPEFIPCRYDVFTEDTPAARLLKWAAGELSGLVATVPLAAALRGHEDALRHVADELPPAIVRERITVPPQYGYLDDAVEIARMLASGDALSVAETKTDPARAFLWNTATVFEEFVFEVCRAAAFGMGGGITKSAHHLGKMLPAMKSDTWTSWDISTTPDVVVSRQEWTAVLDAKYKNLRKHPKTEDVYQVMAGGRVLGSSAAALVYPAQSALMRPRSWHLVESGDPAFLHALPLDLNEMAQPVGFQVLADRFSNWLTEWRHSGGRRVVVQGCAAKAGAAV